jgi:hypothetical protein
MSIAHSYGIAIGIDGIRIGMVAAAHVPAMREIDKLMIPWRMA